MVNPTATPRTPPPIASATLRLLRWIVLGFLAINMSSTFLTPYPTGIPLWLFAGLGAWMTAASVLALYRPQLGALAAIVPIGSTLVVGRYGQDIAPTVIIAATVCALASARAAILTIAALLTYVGALRYVGLDLDGVATYLLLILVPAGIGCVVRGLLAFSRRVQVRISDLEARAVQLRLEERSTLADELSALLSQGLAVQQITLDEARRGTDPAVLRGNLLAVEHHARESLAQLRGLVSTLRGREASTPTTGTPTLTASAEEVEDLLVGHGHPVVLDVPASEELVGDFTRRTLGDVLRRAGPLVAAQAPPGVECVVSVSVAADMVTVELAHPLGDQPMADDAAALGDSARLSASLRHDQEAVLAAGGTFSAGTQGDGWALRAALPQRASAVAPGGRVPAGDASRPGLGRVVLRVGLLRWGAALVLVVGTVLLAGRASAALHTGSADWPTAALWALLCAALAVACWRVRPAVPLLALVLLLGLVASPASPVFAQPPHVAGIALAAILCAGHRRWVWAILLGWTAYTILWFRGELTLDSFGAMLVSPFLGIALGLPAHHFLQLRVEQQRQLAAADWHHRQAREEVRHELAGNRFAVRYKGPDRKYHTAGMTFSNEIRAQGWLAQELGLIERGEWTPPAGRRKQVEVASATFDEFARDWIDKRLVRGRPLKDRSKEHYLDIHERWFAPFHNLPLTSITTADVERWFHSRPDAPTMRTHAYSLLKAIFRTAVARKVVKESPVSVEGATSRAVPKEITLLTVAQVQELADAMRPQHRLMVLLAAWCSLRFGELTGLRRRDIHLSEDFTEGTITVEQAAVTVAGERLLTTPKSLAGHRTIYLPPHLIEDVRQHLDTYTRSDPDSLVFPGTDGRPLTPGQVYGHAPRFDRRGKQKHPGNGFYKARHQIGRPDFRFHDLRHFRRHHGRHQRRHHQGTHAVRRPQRHPRRHALPRSRQRPEEGPRQAHDGPGPSSRRRLRPAAPVGAGPAAPPRSARPHGGAHSRDPDAWTVTALGTRPRARTGPPHPTP